MVRRYGFLYCFIYIVSYGVLAYVYRGDWDDRLATFANLASASIGIALLIPIIIEGGRSFYMVLKEFLTRELTKKAVREKQLMWEAWNKRREEFEEENRDKKFPESPPSSGE